MLAEEVRVQAVDGGPGEEANELRVVSCWIRTSARCRLRISLPALAVYIVSDISGLLYNLSMTS